VGVSDAAFSGRRIDTARVAADGSRFPEGLMAMSRLSRSIHAATIALVFATAPSTWRATPAAVSAAPLTAEPSLLPDHLSDAEFWTLVSDMSEPGGYFRITDNYTSNEREVGQLFAALREAGVQGGVYLGVGPEQNFSYIAAIRPAMAFVVDIRRQAVMQHLMFKAVFELARDRADFIALLFSKPRPADLDDTTPIQRLWEAYQQVPTDHAVAARNSIRIVEQLTRTHQFTLTAAESAQLESVLAAFVHYGPTITTRGVSGAGGGGNNVTFADLTGWSLDASGQPQSFLSTEESFRLVKSLHGKNLILPVSGDFGGPKAIRAIGAYLKKQGGVVSTFYVSNVEQYLFQDGKQRAFYDNVATLPINDRSVFIRPYSLRRGGGTAQSLCGIAGFLSAVGAARISSNNDALACIR
jgi:hypothetical protein